MTCIIRICIDMTWLWLAGVFLFTSPSFAAESEHDAIPDNTCIIELNLPEGAKVSVNGRDYSGKRRLVFDSLEPGKIYSSELQIQYNKDDHEQRALLIRGGWRLSVAPHLPPVHLEMIPQTGPMDKTASAVFSHDGRHLLTSHWGGQLALWETATGRMVRSMTAPYGSILAVDFKKDKPHIVVAGVGPRKLGWTTFDLTTGATFDSRHMEVPGDLSIGSGVMCIDAQRLITDWNSGPTNTQIAVWNMRTGSKSIHSVSIPSGMDAPIAISPDGKRALVGQGWDPLKKTTALPVLVDLESGKTLRSFPVTNSDQRFVFGSDGQSLLMDSSRNENRTTTSTISIWGLRADSPRNSVTVSGSVVLCPNGDFLSISSNFEQKTSETTLWNALTGQKLKTFGKATDSGSAVAFSDDGRQLFAHSALWDVETTKKRCALEKSLDVLQSFHVSGDNHMVVATRVRDESLLAQQPRDTKNPLQEAYNATPHVRFTVRDMIHGQDLSSFTVHDDKDTVLLSSDKTRAIIRESQKDERGDVKEAYVLWDVATGKQLRSFADWDSVSLRCFMPDNRHILGEFTETTSVTGSWSTTSPPRIGLWDLQTGERIMTFQDDSIAGMTPVVAVSRDGRRVLASCTTKDAMSGDKTNPDAIMALLWDVDSGQRLHRLTGHHLPVTSEAFSQDGRQIATGTGGLLQVGRWASEVVLWDAVSGKRLRNLEGTEGQVTSLNFSQDGGLLVATSGVPMDTGIHLSQISVWDTTSGARLRNFEDIGPSMIRSARFLRDARILMAEYYDHMRLYDLATGEELARFVSLDSGKDWLIYTPEGFFDGSQGGRQKVVYRMSQGLELIPVDRFFQDFYRPGLLSDLLQGNREHPEAALGKTLPPKVRIVSPQHDGPVETPQVTLDVEVEDQSGGIKGPWITHNGAKVLTTGLMERQGKIVRRQFQLGLVEGENCLEAWAANADGSWESEPARLTLRYEKPLPKPMLHLLAVSGNRYEDATMNLKFAAKDVQGLVDVFRQRGPALYEHVRVTTILDDQATKTKIFEALASLTKTARPQDTLVVFLAGHGYRLDQQLYLLPSDFRRQSSTFDEDVRQQGLLASDIGDHLAAIPALRRIVVFDTGQSDPATALLARSRNSFTFRGIVERLSRSQGAFTLFSFAASSNAHEVPELEHGVLSYTLLAGLHAVDKGPLKDSRITTGQDRVVDVLQWFNFASLHTRQLAKQYFGEEQDLQLGIAGASFPVLPVAGSDVAVSPQSDATPKIDRELPNTSAVRHMTPSTERTGNEQDLHMVAVGINQYAAEVKSLQFARSDAEAMADLFEKRGGGIYGDKGVHVARLLDADATVEKIKQALSSVADRAKPADIAIAFLAGHGAMVGQRYYFIPHEFRGRSQSMENDIREQGLPADVLRDEMMKIPARKRVLILDTCAAGGALGFTQIGRESFAFRGAIEKLGERQGVFTIAAASANKEAQEINALEHGVLTYALLAGLRCVSSGPLENQWIHPSDPSGVVDVLEWFSFASGQVPRLTQRFLHYEQDVQTSAQGVSFPVLPPELTQ